MKTKIKKVYLIVDYDDFVWRCFTNSKEAREAKKMYSRHTKIITFTRTNA